MAMDELGEDLLLLAAGSAGRRSRNACAPSGPQRPGWLNQYLIMAKARFAIVFHSRDR